MTQKIEVDLAKAVEQLQANPELADLMNKMVAPGTDKLATRAREYLELRDTRLLARDGPARDDLEGCEKALRDVYLIVCGKEPEHHD